MKNKYPFLLEIPAQTYHADSAAGRYVSSHNLATFRVCPLTYHLLMTGKMRRPETPALALGRAIHCYTLEGFDAWNREFTVSDGPINKATGQPYGRTSQKFIDFMASQSKSVVSTKEFEAIERMAENVWSHPEAKQLLASGIAEGTIRIEDYCGLPVQARLDWFSPEFGVADLKTTSEGLEWFEATAHKYGMAHQMAWYRKLLELASGVKYPVYIIAVEKSEPYRVCTFRYAEDVLDQAEAENESALRELVECRERDEWLTRFQETRAAHANLKFRAAGWPSVQTKPRKKRKERHIMSLLERITTGVKPRPPRILVYGPAGVGKSSWAAQAPSPVFIPVEDGIDHLSVPRFDHVTDYAKFVECLKAVRDEQHDFQTLVIDSLTALQNLVTDGVCKAAGVKFLETAYGGYNRGQSAALTQMRKEVYSLLDEIRAKRNMASCRSHTTTSRT